MKYRVSVTILDKGTISVDFKNLEQAIGAVSLFFAGVNWEKKDSNSSFLASMIKQRNCPRAGVESNMRDWSVSIEKVI